MHGLKFDFQSDTTTSFLTVKLDEGIELLEYQLNMIYSNVTPSFVPIKLRRIDGQATLYYDITSRQKLSFILERKNLSKQEFTALLNGIVNALKNMSNLYLSENNLLLDTDFIYVDPGTMEPALIYLPVSGLEEKEVMKGLAEITELLLTKVDLQESMGDNFIHRFLVLLKNGEFSLKEFETILQEIDREKLSPPRPAPQRPPQPAPPSPPGTPARPLQPTPLRTPQPTPPRPSKSETASDFGFAGILSRMPAKKAKIFVLLQLLFILLAMISFAAGLGYKGPVAVLVIAFGLDLILYRTWASSGAPLATAAPAERKAVSAEKPVPKLNMDKKEYRKAPEPQPAVLPQPPSGAAEGTMLLDSPEIKVPCLVSNENGIINKIPISSSPFVIGRIPDQVDYVLDYKPVSRIHAKITGAEDGSYFLEDLNSRNGTFINDNRINSNTRYPITVGDRISIADKEFTFLM